MPRGRVGGPAVGGGSAGGRGGRAAGLVPAVTGHLCAGARLLRGRLVLVDGRVVPLEAVVRHLGGAVRYMHAGERGELKPIKVDDLRVNTELIS